MTSGGSCGGGHGDGPTSGLGRMLTPERVLLLDCKTKGAVLWALIDVLAATPAVGDRGELAAEVWRREALMSTGIGLGVGVPHARLASVRDVVMAAAVNAYPLSDYDSIDSQPVSVVFMVAAGKGQHAEYIRALAMVSRRLKDEALRARLQKARTREEAYVLLTGQGAGAGASA